MFAPSLVSPKSLPSLDTPKEAGRLGSPDDEAIVPLYLRHTQVEIILSFFDSVNLLL